MFVGHFATADAAKRLVPRASLATLWPGGPRLGLGLWNSVLTAWVDRHRERA